MRVDLGTTDNGPGGFDVYVDIVPNAKVPVEKFIQADLRKKWPWKPGAVDHFRAFDFIEHLPDKIWTMNEAWRCLKHGGTFHISVPTTEGAGAWCDPTHVSFWNRLSFEYFVDGSLEHIRFKAHYGITARFKVKREKGRTRELSFSTGIVAVTYMEVLLEAVK